jgi:hypothetical protein
LDDSISESHITFHEFHHTGGKLQIFEASFNVVQPHLSVIHVHEDPDTHKERVSAVKLFIRASGANHHSGVSRNQALIISTNELDAERASIILEVLLEMFDDLFGSSKLSLGYDYH